MPCRLRGNCAHRFLISSGNSRSSNCSNPGAHTPHYVASESPTSFGQCALGVIHGKVVRSSRPNDPMKVMSSWNTILVSPSSAMVSGLMRACSSPSTNMTCMVREHCQPLLDVLSTIQPSSRRCQNLVSQGPHCAADTAASYGQARLAASKHVERKSLP